MNSKMNNKEMIVVQKKTRKKPQYSIHVCINAGGDNLILEMKLPSIKSRNIVMYLIKDFFNRILPEALSRACSD